VHRRSDHTISTGVRTIDGPAPPSVAPGPVRAPAPKKPPMVAPDAAHAPAPVELSLADSVRVPRPVMPSAAPRAPDAAVPERHQAPAVTPEIDRLHAALRRSPIALHVQRLVPLNKAAN